MTGERKVVLCPKCGGPGEFLELGSASGRPYYRCPSCRHEWREKNPAAVALGALGGKARADALTKEELSKQGEDAAKARWKAEKQRRNTLLVEKKLGLSSGKR